MMRSIGSHLRLSVFSLLVVVLSHLWWSVAGFQSLVTPHGATQRIQRPQVLTQTFAKISNDRREQLGIGDDEDEYDLGVALNTNTDPLITKIIAGSFILVVIGLLTVGVIIPATADYGDGVCNPLLTAGRC